MTASLCLWQSNRTLQLEVESIGPYFFTHTSLRTHLHPAYHFILLGEGRCDVQIDKKTINTTKGALLFINPMISHSFSPDPHVGARHDSLVCNLRDTGGEVMLQPLQRIIAPGNCTPAPDYTIRQLKQTQMDHFCKLMSNTKAAARGTPSFCYQMNLFTFFLYAIELLFPELLTTPEEDASALPVHIAHAKEIIAGEYNNQGLNVTLLAHRLGLHPNYLNFLFKKHLGSAVGAYLQTYRFDIARQLLKNSNIAVAKIAHSCGFEHHSSFARKFKELTGLSPKEYRKLEAK